MSSTRDTNREKGKIYEEKKESCCHNW